MPFIGGLYVGNLHVHVVDAHDVGATIEVETLQLPFYLINLVIELDGQPGGILHPQRLPLPYLFARLDPARREATRRAAAVQTLQIVGCRDAGGGMRETRCGGGGGRLAPAPRGERPRGRRAGAGGAGCLGGGPPRAGEGGGGPRPPPAGPRRSPWPPGRRPAAGRPAMGQSETPAAPGGAMRRRNTETTALGPRPGR